MRYTRKENEIIAREVGNSPMNLTAAFESAARKLSRTPNGVRQQWYNHLRGGNPAFVVIGKNCHVANAKLLQRGDKATKHKVGFWKELIGALD